jgi:hypothetical protein
MTSRAFDVMIESLSPTKAFINVDFPTFDFRLYLQNLLYVPFNILFILQR